MLRWLRMINFTTSASHCSRQCNFAMKCLRAKMSQITFPKLMLREILVLLHRHLNYLQNKTCKVNPGINNVVIHSINLLFVGIREYFVWCNFNYYHQSLVVNPLHVNYLQNKTFEEDLDVAIDSIIIVLLVWFRGHFPDAAVHTIPI